MKSDKEFLGEKRESKIIKTELLDSPLLFILLFVVVGLPVNDQLVGLINQWGMNKTSLINYFHVNKRRLVILIYATILQ